jgi:hypothetical protein
MMLGLEELLKVGHVVDICTSPRPLNDVEVIAGLWGS